MKSVTRKLKYLLPAAPIAGVLVSATLAAHGNLGVQNNTQLGQDGQSQPSSSSQAGLAPDVNVSVNGDPVDTSADHTTTVDTPGGQAAVTVTGSSSGTDHPGQTVTTTNPDGTLNITVGSSSNTDDSRTSIRLRGGSSSKFRDNSSTSVRLTGEGSATATQ